MNMIVAVDNHWAIGNKGELLIRIPNDHKHFREETTGKVVVLGRKTLETFPQGLPLKNRINIILSTNPNFKVKDAIVVHSIEELLEELKKYDSEDVSSTYDRLYSLHERGLLFAAGDEGKLMLEGEYSAENAEEISEALKCIKSEGKNRVSFIGSNEYAEKLAKELL